VCLTVQLQHGLTLGRRDAEKHHRKDEDELHRASPRCTSRQAERQNVAKQRNGAGNEMEAHPGSDRTQRPRSQREQEWVYDIRLR
jgi:hypothetical protein